MQAEAHKPVYCTAASLSDGERYCTCCERDLSGGAVRMLEYDQRTWTYHDLRGVPEDQSQGWFPFGLTCAKNKLKEHRAKAARITSDKP
jgi:hypothetical protein